MTFVLGAFRPGCKRLPYGRMENIEGKEQHHRLWRGAGADMDHFGKEEIICSPIAW